MLEKRTILKQIEIQPDSVLFVEELNQIVDDGKIISSIPHRFSVCPLDDVSNSPYENLKIIAKTLWTKKLKNEYAEGLRPKGLVK